jgi:murein DD-endopeptidase MepM/ murein hydrolase activator NlpD
MVTSRPQSLRTCFIRSLLIGIVLSSAGLLPKVFAASWTVKVQPVRLVNGAPVLFRVKAPARFQSLRGTWLGHEISFSLVPASKTWVGLGGVSLETAPGVYLLELSGETSAGESAAKGAAKQISFTRKFLIRRANYPKTQITVDRKFTEPSPEQQKQIEEGQLIKKDYLNRVTPERKWAGRFAAPADAPISDVFGTQRVFNGKTQSSHLGLDFRVPSGTPVAAMNAGTVLLARPLYFEGNCVVLDHGQGLLTIYMHLSEFKVKEGEQVARGQEVGLSGGTGRATGPHLHIAVRWQGTYLDPAVLIKLPLP